MRLQLKYTVFLILATIFMILYYSDAQQVEETIIFFPIDSTLQFEQASTHLLAGEGDKETYSLDWQVRSSLDQSAYLRQDVSLLFKNGVLEDTLKSWKQNRKDLTQTASLEEGESALFEAITFHYAELHPSKNMITSVQQMSKDKLYTDFTNQLQSFHNPLSKDQEKVKAELDSITKEIALQSVNEATKKSQVNPDHYKIISLTDLPSKKNQWLSSFPSTQREEIIGKLWEGLYKNYVLGIKKEDGSVVSSKGSTIPQLLVAKDKSEILVLFTSKDGTLNMLRQKL